MSSRDICAPRKRELQLSSLWQRLQGQPAAGDDSHGSTSVLCSSLSISALPAQEGPRVSEALSLEAIKQLGCEGGWQAACCSSPLFSGSCFREGNRWVRGDPSLVKSHSAQTAPLQSPTLAPPPPPRACFPAGRAAKSSLIYFFLPVQKLLMGLGESGGWGRGVPSPAVTGVAGCCAFGCSSQQTSVSVT